MAQGSKAKHNYHYKGKRIKYRRTNKQEKMIRQTLFKGNTTMGLYSRGARLGSTPKTANIAGD